MQWHAKLRVQCYITRVINVCCMPLRPEIYRSFLLSLPLRQRQTLSYRTHFKTISLWSTKTFHSRPRCEYHRIRSQAPRRLVQGHHYTGGGLSPVTVLTTVWKKCRRIQVTDNAHGPWSRDTVHNTTETIQSLITFYYRCLWYRIAFRLLISWHTHVVDIYV